MASILSETGQIISSAPLTEENELKEEKTEMEKMLERHKETERLQTLDLYCGWVYLMLSKFMKQWYGISICDYVAIVLLGVEMAENFFTLMDEQNPWNYFHKMFIFMISMHCAHAIFYQMAIWSDCTKAPSLNSVKLSPQSCYHGLLSVLKQLQETRSTTKRTSSWYGPLRQLLKHPLKQLPLPVLGLLAVLHSTVDVYFFYCLTGFIRQNFIKETGWFIWLVGWVDLISVLVAFLWLRWAFVFYSHEANELQNNEQTWQKIFNIRWKYAAQCTCVLSFLLMGVVVMKVVHGVPYMKPNTVHTTLTATSWHLQITTVTLITFISSFPHAVCQILAIAMSAAGIFYGISAGEAEIHGEVYNILYLLIPGAMAIAALVYHVCFSPGTSHEVLWTKIVCEVISIAFFFLMLVAVHSEKITFVQYAVAPYVA